MKYYEILPTHTETPRNATRKIANLHIEFNYHFLTLQKKNPITFEQECTHMETLSALLILFEGNPAVTGIWPLQKASDARC